MQRQRRVFFQRGQDSSGGMQPATVGLFLPPQGGQSGGSSSNTRSFPRGPLLPPSAGVETSSAAAQYQQIDQGGQSHGFSGRIRPSTGGPYLSPSVSAETTSAAGQYQQIDKGGQSEGFSGRIRRSSGGPFLPPSASVGTSSAAVNVKQERSESMSSVS